MIRLRNSLYLVISIPILIILIWFFAIPDNLIKTAVENSISGFGKSNINASIKGVRKGIFFTVYADSLEMEIDKTTALRITDISSAINPLLLLKRQFAFSVKGNIGTGVIDGFFKFPVRFGLRLAGESESDKPEKGNLKISNVELNAIPYLESTGLEATGLISASLGLKNNTVDIIFKIPDADIRGSLSGIALPVNSFRKIQGALSLKENTIKIKSINLETDRGHARIKGDIKDGTMNLVMELMPSVGGLNSLESTLISRYQISPGYYVIPIKGPLL